jgi:6-pyruvoyltetrahydropterin/6-carboxytetrahydropterin synthase
MTERLDRHVVSRSAGINLGHRVASAVPACAGIHGHHATVAALCTVRPPLSSSADRPPPDPGFIADVLRAEVVLPCDGAMVLSSADPLANVLRPAVLLGVSELSVDEQGWWEGAGEFGRLYLIADPPTPENLARHWFARMAKPMGRYSAGTAELAGVKVRLSPDMEAAFGPAFGMS